MEESGKQKSIRLRYRFVEGSQGRVFPNFTKILEDSWHWLFPN